MILIVGSSKDPVVNRVVLDIQAIGHQYAIIDCADPNQYSFQPKLINDLHVFRIVGGNCIGRRQIGCVFLRYPMIDRLTSLNYQSMLNLITDINKLILFSQVTVVNPPYKSYENYAKPLQLFHLAKAGFNVPRTLVTNSFDQLAYFYNACKGKVIMKGVSNMRTLATLVEKEQLLQATSLLSNCPTQFQEYIHGADYRVHVVNTECFITRIASQNEDYRRSAMRNRHQIYVSESQLPVELVENCVKFTRDLGLVISGMDFKEADDGKFYALELNPYPQFTFYEGYTGQRITRSVVHYLIENDRPRSYVFA